MKGGIVTALFAGFVFPLFSALPAVVYKRAATLKEINGKVTIQRGESVLTPKPRDPVMVGDTISTGENSSAGFVFLDGSRIRMGASSSVRVTRYRFALMKKNCYFDLMVNEGSAIYTSGKIGKLSPDGAIFRTPVASLGIRGAKFKLTVI